MIRVRYNQNTTLVNGNFPNIINYPNIEIDEINKTLTNSEGTFPFVEIEDSAEVIRSYSPYQEHASARCSGCGSLLSMNYHRAGCAAVAVSDGV